MHSFVASPFCSWLVATYMSVAYEKEHPVSLSVFHSSKRSLTQWAKRNQLKTQQSINSHRNIRLSSFYNSSFQNIIARFMTEPWKEHHNSKGLPWSLASLVDNNISLYGLKGTSNTVAANCTNQTSSADSGNCPSSSEALEVKPEKKTLRKKNPPEKRRVVVTGLGVVTPVGHDPHVFYDNLLGGLSGISEIEGFDCSQFPTKIAGEIKSFSADGYVSPKLSKRGDKFMLYLLTAGKKALADGGIKEQGSANLDRSRCGIIIGSALGGLKIFNDGIEALMVSYKKMNPFCVPYSTTNMGSAMLAIDLGWMGPNYSISTACATSNFCILNAANHILRGETDMMLCGGTDAAINPVGLGGFVVCKALSQRNSEPTKASRPWDSNRDGFVLGEGAAVLLLEELEHAKRRGADIYAEFLGGSFTSDAYHMIKPHPQGKGMILCLDKALTQSGVRREDINYINAHAASTQTGDLKEFAALIHCFGENAELRINSTKSMIGHLLGASGAVEAVATVKAIKTGWIHPNVNLENPDRYVDTRFLVGRQKERLDIKVALSTSFGIGGHNSSILFAPYK